MNKLGYLFIIGAMSFFSCKKDVNSVVEKNEYITKKFSITKDSVHHGSYEVYDNDNHLLEKATYDNGLLEGDRYIYYVTGEVEIKEKYKDGQLDGDYYIYYKDGTLQFQARYQKGSLEGTAKSFYPNGTLKETVTFRDNKENGSFTEYYENGNLKWNGTYKEGPNEIEELLNYDSSGVLQRKLWCNELSICQTTWTVEDGDIEPEHIEVSPPQ